MPRATVNDDPHAGSIELEYDTTGSSDDPPLLLLHGDQDPQMPINQAHELCGAYEKAGLPVQFVVIHGAAHGGAIFYDAERLATVKRFLGMLQER